MSTRAAILARYLDLNYESAPWLYHEEYHSFAGSDPLSDSPWVNEWLGALVQHPEFYSLLKDTYEGPFIAEYVCAMPHSSPNPVHALIAAMRAADPALDAEMDRADG